MCATRAVLEAKRSSAGRSGSPIASHSRANSRSLPHATAIGAVGGLEGLVRRDARVAVAAPLRALARRHPARALVEQRGQHRVEQRDLDVAAGAGALALDQRGLDPGHREQPAHEVDDRRADLDRRAARLAGDAHEPAHRLQQQVVARQPGRALGGAERGDRARDEPRVARRPQRVAVEAPGGEQPGPERLDQHVGARPQLARQLAVALVAEVERDRALVAVEPQVVGRLAVAPRRPPVARVVARLRPLDLDHVGAEVAQRHRGERPREHAREVGDEEAFERAGTGGHGRGA